MISLRFQERHFFSEIPILRSFTKYSWKIFFLYGKRFLHWSPIRMFLSENWPKFCVLIICPSIFEWLGSTVLHTLHCNKKWSFPLRIQKNSHLQKKNLSRKASFFVQYVCVWIYVYVCILTVYFQKISLRFPLQWLVLRIFIYGKPCNIIKRRLRHGCFPVNFVNTFFTEQLWVEASVGLHKVPKIYITLSACNANSECEICFIEIDNHEDVFLENLGSIESMSRRLKT